MSSRGEISKALLESLLTRLEARTTTEAVTIEISRQEIGALRHLLFGDEKPVESGGTSVSAVKPREKLAEPKIDWQAYNVAPTPGHRLCIDFGTAFSKACLIGEGDAFVKPLPIGERGGFDRPLMVPSSVLVHQGRIYFGQQAIARSRSHAIRHRRIDALKQFLSKGEITNVDEQRLDSAYADGETWLTKGAVLRLYCAYLSALAEASAKDLGFEPARLARRFARPAWDKDRGASAERFMQRMLADSRIIADQLRGQWTKGVDVELARALLQAVAKRPEKTYHPDLVLDSVLEATAAANAVSGGFRDLSGRRLLAVVDVGAGTTDFGLFVLRSDPDSETMLVWELTPGSRVLRQAGDTLDEVLASMLREQISAPKGTDIEGRALAKLQNERRFLKEELFATGSASHRTDEDQEVSVSLAAFNAHPDVQRFSENLQKRFDECLSAVDEEAVSASGNNVLVVLTGGGAALPMVRDLLRPKAGHHRCKEITVDLAGLLAIDPRLPDVFPQLAVAFGGAMETLPEQRESFGNLGAGGRQRIYWKSWT
jgi:molecular chaperone DnaK (HSP70)